MWVCANAAARSPLGLRKPRCNYSPEAKTSGSAHFVKLPSTTAPEYKRWITFQPERSSVSLYCWPASIAIASLFPAGGSGQVAKWV